MKVTVIGYYGGSAPANEATSAYLVEIGDKYILLDCGTGSLSLLQNLISLNDLDHVILSHYHWDHFSDIGAFIYNRYVRNLIGESKNPLNIYTQKDDLHSKSFEEFDTNRLYYIDKDSLVEIEGAQISFMETKHPLSCLAIKVEYKGKTLVYTADAGLNEELIEFSMGCDLLITECSLYSGFDGSKSGHMNADDVAKLINKSECKKAIISHLPIYGNPIESFLILQKLTRAKLFLAKKFLKVKI